MERNHNGTARGPLRPSAGFGRREARERGQRVKTEPERGRDMGGPPPQEQIDSTLQWVTDVFCRYFRENPPPMPPRFARREFGFLWNGNKFFFRHTGFRTPAELHHHMAERGPHHSYYSTAYYKTPNAATMKEKDWLGADLIFDLDADHLPGGDKMSFADQLAAVKKQAEKLLDDFLLGDFGFAPEHVRIVFSGGRGYHFHVSDPRVLSMDSAARREIVDYLSPNDTVAGMIRERWIVERTTDHKFGHASKVKTIPPATVGGWPGHLTKVLADYLEELAAMPLKDAVDELQMFKGIGEVKAKKALATFTPALIARLRTGADWHASSNERFELPPGLQQEALIRALVEKIAIRAEGETDEPVTADIKRLIRLPGSLHGKTGLRVTPLSIDEFRAFDPLRDAVALGDEPVRIVVSKPTEVALRGETITVQPGEQELPLYQAAFVVLRRAALRP